MKRTRQPLLSVLGSPCRRRAALVCGAVLAVGSILAGCRCGETPPPDPRAVSEAARAKLLNPAPLAERLRAAGLPDGLLAPRARLSVADRLGLRALLIEERPEALTALEGDDEPALLTAMRQAGAGFVLVERAGEPRPGPGAEGGLRFRLLTNGRLDYFDIVETADQWVMAAPTHPALTPNPDHGAAVVAYVRAGLRGQTATLPTVFDAPGLDGASAATIRLADAKGAIFALGGPSGWGETPRAALDAAVARARALWPSLPKQPPRPSLEAAAADLRLTVALDRARARWVGAPDAAALDRRASLGLDGFVVRPPEGEPFVIRPESAFRERRKIPAQSNNQRDKHVPLTSPSELLDAACLANRLERRCWTKGELDSFRAAAWTETAPGGEAVRLYRGDALTTPEALTRAAVRDGFMAGARRLLADFNPQTRMFRYSYFAREDRATRNRYNLIRHLLATMTLLQAHELGGDPAFLETANAALDFVVERLETEKTSDGRAMAYFDHPKYDRKVKLGGAATLILALIARHERAPRSEDLPILDQLGEFILHMQQPNGRWRSYFARPDETPDEQEVLIYPGEAHLALLRLNRLRPDPRYMAALRRARAAYRPWFAERARPGARSVGVLGAYLPWEITAMAEWARNLNDPEAAAYAYEMADWLLSVAGVEGPAQAWHPDFVGGLASSPQPWRPPEWSAAVYAEGLSAAWALARARGDAERAERYRRATWQGLRFIRQLQIKPSTTWRLPHAEAALGAIPAGFFDDECRLDFIHHAMTVAWRALREADDADFAAWPARAVSPAPAGAPAERE